MEKAEDLVGIQLYTLEPSELRENNIYRLHADK